ncbi:MAG: FAD-dependent oxidoreductase [Chthoniobacteraceae bacterium]
MYSSLQPERHEFDVCVIGGGMAGLCAAIAAARNGAKTAIVHDRPMFGGNASSEVRMWICGARGEHNRETGILEEIQLENQYVNPDGNYSVWDGLLWGKLAFQPNLTVFLNCACTGAEMDGDHIAAITAWQLTTQTWHKIHAKLFIDCSGDSILAPLTGADFRTGREARAEFNEDIEPHEGDLKTMGNSLLIQFRRTAEPHPFAASAWAYKFESPADFPHRMHSVNGQNFWWIEVGGLQDTIRDGEKIRDELTRITYGVVDYIKNRAPERAQAENWAVEWIGSLPGKRENRRYMGDHILTQNDVRGGGRFEDIIAYGGWPMDDHHPAGIYFPGKPTIFHPAPTPFGIPYRSLYSRNIKNLLFAGRNISVTHAALSSTRVMGTCAILGQAAGTAAALCVKHSRLPRDLSGGEALRELQATLMEDDCWLPGLRREISPLALEGQLCAEGNNAALLLDGLDRDRPGEVHAWSAPSGANAAFHWQQRVQLGGVRLVFDSDLNFTKRMPCSYPRPKEETEMPRPLVKAFRLETLGDDGAWRTVYRQDRNHQRLAVIPLAVKTRGLRLIPEETWGGADARVFAFEPLFRCMAKLPSYPDGPEFSKIRAAINRKDLEPPAGG